MFHQFAVVRYCDSIFKILVHNNKYLIFIVPTSRSDSLVISNVKKLKVSAKRQVSEGRGNSNHYAFINSDSMFLKGTDSICIIFQKDIMLRLATRSINLLVS